MAARKASDELVKKMQAKAKTMVKAWDQASMQKEGKLGITFSIDTKLPAGISKRIKETISVDLQNNLYSQVPVVAEALNEAIESPVWNWNGEETVRKSGEVVTNPRDIVDTGALADSLTITHNGLGLVVSYRAPYAAIVHYGGVTWNGGQIQARPWTEAVLLGGGPIDQVNWANILQGR